MHIFYQYVVLEYELRHSTRWLKNVQISVEPDSESFIYIGTVSPIQILGPGLSRYTYLIFEKNPLSFGDFVSTVSFLEAESKEAVEAMDGPVTSMIFLNNFDVGVLHYLNRIPIQIDFEGEWQKLGNFERTISLLIHPNHLENFIVRLKNWFLVCQAQDPEDMHKLCFFGQCCGLDTLVLLKAFINQPGENQSTQVHIVTRTENSAFQAAILDFVARG